MKMYDAFETRALAGQPQDSGLVVDAHGHLGVETAFPQYAASLDSVLAAMDRIGIGVLCASPFLVLSRFAREGNDVVIEAVRRHPDRFFGYMIAEMGRPESILPELERCYEAGLRGIKIHSRSGPPYAHPNYERLYRFAGERRLPILAHTEGRPELDDLEPVFERHPDIRFILAHAGCLARERYAAVARRHPQVYLETCVSQCTRGLIEFFATEGLAGKLLYGSDMTLIAAEHQIGRIIFAGLPEADKAGILGNTARAVLGLAAQPERTTR